jgi:hypothetical protein
VPHIVLFLFVAAEDADFADIAVKETPENGIAERAGAAGDEEGFVFKHKNQKQKLGKQKIEIAKQNVENCPVKQLRVSRASACELAGEISQAKEILK